MISLPLASSSAIKDVLKSFIGSVKGFAPVFCVDALVEHVVQVEVLSKHGDTAKVSEAFRKLAPQLEQLRNEVAAHLAANQLTLD